MSAIYRFGPFELEEHECRLRVAGQEVALTRRVFSTLLFLVRNPGRLVRREELMAAVWGTTHVEEGNLHTTVSTLRKALAEHSAETFIETTRGLGYRFVAPVSRPPETSRGLEAEPLDPLAPRRRRSDSWGHRLAPIFLALFLGAFAWRLLPQASQPPAAAPYDSTLAVLGFANLSPSREAEWLGTTLSELVAAELALGNNLAVVPAERIAEMRRDLARPAGAVWTEAELSRARRHLGCEATVAGSFLLQPNGEMVVQAELRGAGSAPSVKLRQVGSQQEIFRLAAEIASDLRRSLGLQAATADGHAMPRDPEARRLYAEGLDLARRFELTAAGETLRRVTALEPDFTLGWLELSKVEGWLGNSASALAAAEQAQARSASLPENLRLAIAANRLKLGARWPEAITHYRRLWDAEPTNPERAFDWVYAQLRAQQAPATQAALAEVERVLPATAQDARFAWLAEETEILSLRFPQALPKGRRALALARSRGAVELETRILLSLALAHTQLATAADRQAASALASDLETLLEHSSNPLLAAHGWTVLAGVLGPAGRLREVREAYEQAVAIYRQLGGLGQLPSALRNLSGASFQLGDLNASERQLREALALCEAGYSPDCRARLLIPQALNLLYGGQLERARQLFEEAIPLHQAAGSQMRVAEANSFLFDLESWSANPEALLGRARRLLALRQEIGIAEGVAYARLDLAQALRSTGDLEAAGAQVELALQTAEKELLPHLLALAQSSRARLRLARGDLAGAERDTTAYRTYPPPVSPLVSFTLWLDRCEVLIELQRFTEAEALLEQGLTVAAQGGFVAFELEGKLLKVKLAQRAGRGDEARLRAEDLSREAGAKGFAGIVQQLDKLSLELLGESAP